jgi:periplasmic copper chaperone A
MMSNTIKFIAACAVFTWTTHAFSHVTLEQTSVEAGSYYKAVLRVGHGCEGMPTATVRAVLPAGFQGAKPMPKAGWSIQIRKQALATPYDNHGSLVTEDVAEISWTATSPETYLPDNQYDEFVLRGKAPATAGPLWFKVTQLCQSGDKKAENAWIEVPTSGTATQGLKSPAALLQVTSPVPSSIEGTETAPVHTH